MLELARVADKRSTFALGDVSDMSSIADNSYDLVTTVYTLRNFPDVEGGITEMIRVLRPGGTLLILDAFPPPFAFMRWLLYLWLVRLLPYGVVDFRARAHLPLSVRVYIHVFSRLTDWYIGGPVWRACMCVLLLACMFFVRVSRA